MDIKIIASSSRGNCYRVSNSIMIECGLPIKAIRKEFNFRIASEISGCLISHEHSDHSKAVHDLMKMSVSCYMSAGTAFALDIDPGHHRLHIVKPHVQFKLGSFQILPFDVIHDAAEPLGFLIRNRKDERLVYITDTWYSKYTFKDIKYYMIECNFSDDLIDHDHAVSDRIVRNHFSLNKVIEFFKANDLSKCKAIYLLHLSDDNSDKERFKYEIEHLTGRTVNV